MGTPPSWNLYYIKVSSSSRVQERKEGLEVGQIVPTLQGRTALKALEKAENMILMGRVDLLADLLQINH